MHGRCVSAVEFGVRRILLQEYVLDSHDAKQGNEWCFEYCNKQAAASLENCTSLFM